MMDQTLKIQFARFLVFMTVCVIASSRAISQEFPEPHNSEVNTQSTLMPAGESAAGFRVPDGFQVSVFAAEPDVRNPIACNWDEKGRLWVAENFTYAERAQRFDLSLKDRIVIHHDTDGDGQADSHQVFTDQLQMLTGLEVGYDGVWVICPPALLFIPDRNHDDIPDGPCEVVVDGFTVAQQNYHNFANGLKWGPDGWLYGRCGGSCPGRIGIPGTPEEKRLALEGGIWRYHPQRKSIEVLTAGTCNPWGHDWDKNYELFFINTVNGHFWHMIPGAHFVRPFTLDPNPYVFESIDMHADHWHFDTGKPWHQSRDGIANDYGGGHAHVGGMIYQAGTWPKEYQGRFMTFNLHGRRINQEIMVPQGSGYVATHGPDMFLSKDEWFRGMELSQGPDGNVYALDWSDTGECHEHTGVHRQSGRIYRISCGERSPRPVSDMTTLSGLDLAQHHASDNEWLVRQSRRLLIERSVRQEDVSSAVSELTSILENKAFAEHHLKSLLTLFSMGQISREQLVKLTTDEQEAMRVWAIRLLTDRFPIDDPLKPAFQWEDSQLTQDATELLPLLRSLAQSDVSARVQLALASTLQRLPINRRGELAEVLVSHAQYSEDHNLPLLVWYGLIPAAQEAPQTLLTVLQNCQWPKTRVLIARRLILDIERHPDLINQIVESLSTSQDIALVRSTLEGFSQGLKGRRQATAPLAWDKFASDISRFQDPELVNTIRNLSVIFGDGRALEELEEIAVDSGLDYGVRDSALQTLITARSPNLQQICIQLLKDPKINVAAAKGLSVLGDEVSGRELIRNYNRFRGTDKPAIISLLVSRPAFAKLLIEAIGNKTISSSDVSAFDIRQMLSMKNADLADQIREIWGEVQPTSVEKRDNIKTMKRILTEATLAKADLARGRVVFEKNCTKCHQLYGNGAKIGPDLTGANRANLDYLLENIIDPSAIVSKNYYASILVLEDGRVLNGLVTTNTDDAVTLQTQTELLTISKSEILEMKTTTQSPMPDGLLKTMTGEEIQNLFGYLMHPQQVDRPAETP